MMFCLQLAKAVLYLHKENIIHRDIALRNVLLHDNENRVMLSDLGMARKVDENGITFYLF